MSDSEILRRLRSGMNAMFDAASADAMPSAVTTMVAERPEPVTVPMSGYRREMVASEAPMRLSDSGYRRVTEPDAPHVRLDESPGYRRDTAEAFSEEDIAFMTGGGR